MTAHVFPSEAFHEEIRHRAGRFRRLPVVGIHGKLAGLLSLDDVLGLLSEEFAQIGCVLHNEAPL